MFTSEHWRNSWVERHVGWLAGLYLAVALAVGLVLIVLVPPFQVPDEPHHFERAYELSQGQLWSVATPIGAGGDLPAAVVGFIACFPDHAQDGGPYKPVLLGGCRPSILSARGGVRRFAEFEATAFYSPLAYFPQVLAITIGKAAGLGIYQQLLAARLLTLLTSAILIFAALRLSPAAAPIVLAVAMLPMSLFEQASASADALVIATSLLYVALAVRASQAGRWRWRVGALACLCATCFVSLKPVYAPILVLPMAPAILTAAGRRGMVPQTVLIAVIAMGVSLFWLIPASRAFDLHVAGVDPHRQVAFIRAHVGLLPALLFKTLRHEAVFYLESAFGILGWLRIALPDQAYLLSGVSLIIAAILSRAAGSRGRRVEAVWTMAVAGGAVVLIMLALYLVCSTVGAGTISGVQGRYFLPVAPVVLLSVSCLAPALTPRWRRNLTWGLAASVAMPVVVMLVELWRVYGGGGFGLLALS